MIPANIINCFKNKLTFAYKPPVSPTNATLCFIPGFHSDFITSKKSNLVYNYAQEHDLGFLSWNHREEDGCSVAEWYQDSKELLKQYKADYFIGGSMGLWISLLLAHRQEVAPPLKGILGIGGGINFTERWLETEAPLKERNNPDFIWKRPSQYDIKGYYEIPISFLINSRPALIDLGQEFSVHTKVHLVHGSLDHDVPIKLAKQLYHDLSKWNPTVQFHEIMDGDHQLSRSQDLSFIRHKIKLMIK
jgi:pimeloyl-ACP methyl ester carboxylesterase